MDLHLDLLWYLSPCRCTYGQLKAAPGLSFSYHVAWRTAPVSIPPASTGSSSSKSDASHSGSKSVRLLYVCCFKSDL